MKKLFFKMCFVFFMVILLSIGIDAAYRHVYHQKYEWPKNLWILPEIKDKYDIVKVGNSHAEDGIDFEYYNLKSLSIASVGQPYSYDLAYLEMYSRQIKPGAVILINASPISFSQGKPGREDALQTQYYDGRISPFLIPDLKIEDYIQSQIMPFLRAGYRWRQDHMDEITKRISAEEKWPTPKSTPTPEPPAGPVVTPPPPNPTDIYQYVPAPYADSSYFVHVKAIEHELAYPYVGPKDMLVDSMNFQFNKWYRTTGFDPKYFDANRKDLERIINFSLQMKWRPVLITIPVSQVLIDGLLPDYMQKYIYDNVAKTNLRGTKYFNFMTDKQLTTDKYLFSNSDHLNSKGAVIFSYLLLRRLIDNGYLPKSADGYDYIWNNAPPK